MASAASTPPTSISRSASTVSNDATGGLGPDAYKATLTNYAFIAHESITAEEALSRLA